MNIDEIRSKFRSGEMDAQEAIKELAPFTIGRLSKQASVLVDEILGMPSEPKEMSSTEKDAAETWERGNREG